MSVSENILRIAGIENDSIVDGPGIRMTIFVQGCPHACEGCHNPQTWDFHGGMDMSIDAIMARVCSNPLLDGVTFSGGEPFCQAKKLARLGKLIKEKGLNIITYTGYTYEELTDQANDHNGFSELLGITDILIDGKFILAQKDLTLKFRGSANQRIIDVRKTREEGKIVLCDI